MIDYFLVTTDVQGVVFTRVLEEDTFSIQCSYLNGSNVSGCVYVLVSGEDGVENVTGFIESDSNGVTLEVVYIGCYSEVLAYDNTTTSTTTIEILPVRTCINTSETCPITIGKQLLLKIPILCAFCMLTLTLASPPDPSTTTPPPSGGPNVAAIAGGIVGVILAVLVAVLVVVLVVVLCLYKGNIIIWKIS